MTRTIEAELAACRAAFEAFEAAHGAPATWAHGVHHAIAFEPLTEGIEERIRYIRVSKPLQEQAVRFANLRPIDVAVVPRAKAAARDKADAAWTKAEAALEKYIAARAKAAAAANRVPHARICPIPETCTWDGKTFLGAAR